MNKYEQYCKKYEQMGMLKPIYKNQDITICNVCGFCYYLFENETGLAINVRADALKQIIEDPGPTFAYFNSLPIHIRKAISFFVNMQGVEKFFSKVQEKAKKEPERIVVDLELEKQIMQEYGMAGRSK